MPFLVRVRIALGLALLAVAAVVCPRAGAQGKAEDNSRQVDFQTGDGVTLMGRFWRARGEKKRDAVVILLHDFNAKGGSSAGSGWQDLAGNLQSDGYAVLAFDFRGFGESTTVNKEKFWSKKHNLTGFKKGVAAKKPETINRSQFTGGYFAHLTSDVAAARAYLERRNDAKDVNVANIILIGAGDGATVAAAWMYNEACRRRDKSELKHPVLMPPKSGSDPESKDIAAALFFSISPTMGGYTPGKSLHVWAVEAGKGQKIPIGFINGEKDKDMVSRNLAAKLFSEIKPSGGKGPKPKDGKGVVGKDGDPMRFTSKVVLNTNLSGDKLLTEELGTFKMIRKYLDELLTDRGAKEWEPRESAKARFFYTPPRKDQPLKVAKPFNQDVPEVDVSILKK